MVKKASGKDGYRSFTIISAGKHGSCKTKFGLKGNGGRYISRNASGAARKAFTELCRTKRIRGVCTLIITIKETTTGSNGKVYTYKLKRNKLKQPIIMMEGTDKEYVIEYNTTIKSVKTPVDCPDNKKGQTRGRKKRKTTRKHKLYPNNVKKMYNSSKKNKNNNK